MEITATAIRAIAACWLRYEWQCPIVTFERGLGWFSRPDVLGVRPTRRIIEIEIKVTVADFRHDRKKRKWWLADDVSRGLPERFYFMVPPAIADKVKPELPDGAGLLTIKPDHLHPHTGLPLLRVLVDPKANFKSSKVSMKDAFKLVKHNTGTLCSLAVSEANHEIRRREG